LQTISKSLQEQVGLQKDLSEKVPLAQKVTRTFQLYFVAWLAAVNGVHQHSYVI
jgi:hypothetical protein